MGYIYKIVNKIDGKVYVGQTNDPKERWHGHRASMNRHDYKNRPLYVSMRKFGIDQFEFIIIEECEEKQMGEREKYWINRLCAKDPDSGYNIVNGCQINTSPVCQYDLDGNYITTYKRKCDAARATGLNQASIQKACDGLLKSCGKFLWRYEGERQPLPYREGPHYIKPVEMYSADGTFLRSYSSMKEAGDDIGIRYQNISDCCRGIKREAGGYIWKFADKKTS